MKKYSRKNFFSTVGKGIIIGFVASVFPLRRLIAKRKNDQKINLHIHPSAVKRNSKV